MKNEHQPSVVIARHQPDLGAAELQHELWNSCPPVQITHYWSGEAAPQSRFAEVRLCWNEQNLTARFVGEQHEPLVINEQPIVNSKTLGLWDRDVCEIFLAPNPNQPQQYFEFEAAPTGEWVDLGITITPSGRQTEWDYASGMEVVTKVEAEQIIVIISIPWSDRLPKPQPETEWRANLFRCVGSDESTRYLAWLPTYTPEPNFHVPDAFGVLRFE